MARRPLPELALDDCDWSVPQFLDATDKAAGDRFGWVTGYVVGARSPDPHLPTRT